jgi:hypothetical protein
MVDAGNPPIFLNASAGKASNLNADKLDDKDSSPFLGSNSVRTDGTVKDSPIDDFTSNVFIPEVSQTLTAPSDGWFPVHHGLDRRGGRQYSHGHRPAPLSDQA